MTDDLEAEKTPEQRDIATADHLARIPAAYGVRDAITAIALALAAARADGMEAERDALRAHVKELEDEVAHWRLDVANREGLT